MKNFYEILGVSEDATNDEIRRAYRKKAMDSHPDLHSDDPDATKNFLEIDEAKKTLLDKAKRKKYDNDLKKYRAMSNISHANNSTPKQNTSSVVSDFVSEILNSYNQGYAKNTKNDEFIKIQKMIEKIDEKIKKVEIDILVIQNSMSHTVHNEYNNKVNDLTKDKTETISNLSSKMTDERNKKRFLSTFFTKVDENIKAKWNLKIKEIEQEFEKKLVSLKNNYESRLKAEDEENQKKQEEIDKKLSEKELLQQEKERFRQIIYSNNTSNYTRKTK